MQNEPSINETMHSSDIKPVDDKLQFTSQTGSLWPEEYDPRCNRLSQFYKCWTYSYMKTVLTIGSQQSKENMKKITNVDLFPVPVRMRSANISDQFRQHYNSDVHNPQEKEDSGDNTDNDSSSSQASLLHQKEQERRLMRTLWNLAAPTFIPAGFCQLITVICQVALPLLVRELLTVVEENPNEKIIKDGMPYALLIFIAAVINGFANHRQRHLALKSGVTMRSGVVNVLYEHALQLSPSGRSGLTSGEVANLIATDAQKLFEVSQEGHLIWSLPLIIILVGACLLLVMGPTTLIGIAVLVLFVPIVERITARMIMIRRKRIRETDKRIEIVNSMLQGIKVTKLNSYEENYQTRATSVRNKELSYLRQELAVWAMTLVIMVTSPGIATGATFAVYVLIDEDHILTASRTFSVLLLFSALRFPINNAGRLMGKATQAYSAIQRLARFLKRDLRNDCGLSITSDSRTSHSSDDSIPLTLENASFYIGGAPVASFDIKASEEDKASSFQVSKFNLTVRKGEVLAVCGPVGSGKSLFVNGIINEMPASAETVVTTKGRISYISQNAFILNTTLRENILFGRPFDREWYEKVIDACGLRTDIRLLGRSKDLTEIGERGVTLSGGQRQRVSLARGVYARPDLVLLDDPLSALDAGTAKLVFERLIKGPDALFTSAAVVLITHAAHFLNRINNILIIVDGENKFLGTWDELASFEAKDSITDGTIQHIRESVQEEASDKDAGIMSLDLGRKEHEDESEIIDHLMTIEEREHGLSSFATWFLWFKRAGGIYFLSLQVLFMAIDRFSYVAVEWWLARWTDGAYNSIDVKSITFPPQTDGLSAQYNYLRVFSSIMLVSVVFTIIRSEWGVTGGARAAKNVHAAMLSRILEAPMSYFESTPMGRVLNRFTYDTEVIDFTLTTTMNVFIISCSWYVAGVSLMCSIMPWMILAILPVTLAYWLLLLHYRKSGPDLQRLDAVSRSPIQAMVSEAMDGGSSIRLYGQQKTFVQRFQTAVDINSAAVLNFVSAQRWLGLRVEILGTLISLISVTLIISLNDVFGIDPGLVGLLIIWSSHFTITLGFLVDSFSEAEAAITAIERVDAMSRIPKEASRKTDISVGLQPSWPKHGELKFDNVCMRYRKGLPLALDNLTFTIPAGKKCGIVGRTGSGKSSLCSALFRLVEVESGQIIVDGINLGCLGLEDVRGRPNGMAIIPQDPFLAGSTLRQCIDPFGKSSDNEILDCLTSVRLASSTDTVAILDSAVDEGGSNYSVGERQLLNLARALLTKPKLLVLDEATASIDGETDAFIQKMLRTKFTGTTQITVAHRLNTIMDFDYILVMDKGRAAEMGSPAELLRMKGLFAQLVDATGPEGSKALRAMVA